MKNNFDRYIDFIRHLPVHANDEALIALKGHLLVEMALREYIYRRVPHPERLKGKQANFPLLIDFASCLENGNDIGWVWMALSKLNSIRNGLAHNLEPKDLKAKEAGFIEYVKANDGELLSITADSSVLKYGPMPLAIFQVFDSLLTSPDQLRKSTGPSPAIEELLRAMAQIDAVDMNKK